MALALIKSHCKYYKKNQKIMEDSQRYDRFQKIMKAFQKFPKVPTNSE